MTNASSLDEVRAGVTLWQEPFFSPSAGQKLWLARRSAVAQHHEWIYFWHPPRSRQMGPSNSFGIPPVLPPVSHYGAGSFVREELPWGWLGASRVNGHCQKALGEVQARPMPPQPTLGGTCCVPGACAGAFTPGPDARVSQGTGATRHCRIGLSQKDTPSV